MDQNMFCQQTFTYPTGLHADHHVNGLLTLESPQVTISTIFICYIGSVALNSAKNNSKTDPNGGNRAKRQNKQQEIIYLNEDFLG